MGVAKTLPNYKSFTFDGTNSRNYGVYITGQGVFNAPERNVEMVEIPGRNGAYALDKGNFNNIEVTYPAGIFADTEADFAQAVSDLRSFLCSKSGYCRLEDDYNSGEYRMAIYKSGLEVTHDMLIAGEFNIVFECKPQRYLTSGETAVAVTSGGKVTNPTLFDARPLLEITGYGDIDLGGQAISVHNEDIGDVILRNNETQAYLVSTSQTIQIDDTYANTGDVITFGQSYARWEFNADNDIQSDTTKQLTKSVSGDGSLKIIDDYMNLNNLKISLYINAQTFAYGTADIKTVVGTINITTALYGTDTGVFTVQIDYNGTDTFTVNYSVTQSFSHYQNRDGNKTQVLSLGTIILASTQTLLGNPLYIDLDIGEAYKIENGSAVSVNNGIEIPAELPTLPSGDTTITYDNTITQFKVLPRWWRV